MSQVDYLKKEIEKTGYPLEIQISSMLDDKWQDVRNTDSYFDSEEKKLRDIDIIATNTFEPPKISPISFETRLVIECKKSDNFAWVFFTRPLNFEVDDISGQFIDKVQIFTRNTENYQISATILPKTHLHYADTKRIAVAYSEFFIEKANETEMRDKHKREIFEAQNQLKKYIECDVDQIVKSGPQMPLHSMFFCFPCIVFDGPLYEAIVEGHGMTLKEANHIVLTTTYRSSYAIFERGVLIDVVQRAYFEEYLDFLKKDEKSLRATISKNSKRIASKTWEIMDLLGSSEAKK